MKEFIFGLCFAIGLLTVALAETWIVRVDDGVGSFYKWKYWGGYAYDDDQRDYIISRTTAVIGDFTQIDNVSTLVSTHAAAMSELRQWHTRDSFTGELKTRTGE